MKLSKKSIQQIRAYLAGKPVNKAYLFGSYVRGEAKEGSDVDIRLVQRGHQTAASGKFYAALR